MGSRPQLIRDSALVPAGLVLAFAVVAFGSISGIVDAADPTIEELLVLWQHRQQSVQNLSIVVEWREFHGGQPGTVTVDTLDLDKSGRIRISSIVNAKGKQPREAVELYNGAFLISQDRDPNKNKLGAGQPFDPSKNQKRYLAAIINNGLGPDGKGPLRHRNPFSFVDGWLIQTVGELTKSGHGKDLQLRPLTGQRGVFEARFSRPLEDDPSGIEHRFLVDQNKGWGIISHEQRLMATGKFMSISSCELKSDQNQVWLPRRGSWRNFPADEKPGDFPLMEWRFEVRDIKLNDPDFDQSIFEGRLEPETYVVDNRHRVSYWVGPEPISGDLLDALSQEAKAKKAKVEDAIRKGSVQTVIEVQDENSIVSLKVTTKPNVGDEDEIEVRQGQARVILEGVYLQKLNELEKRWGLTADQRVKMQTAAWLDIRRITEEMAIVQREINSIVRTGNRNAIKKQEEERSQSLKSRIEAGILGDDTLFSRILGSTLTDSQKQSIDILQIEETITSVHRAVPLSSQQKELLRRMLVNQEVRVPIWSERRGSSKLSEIDESKLKSFLTSEQQIALEPLRRPLRDIVVP